MPFRRPVRRGADPRPAGSGPARLRVGEEWLDPGTWDPAADSSLVPQADLGPAQWIAPLLRPRSYQVAMMAPQGFEAYARVFHPFSETEFLADDEFEEEFISWAEMARRHGRTAHALMEHETIQGDEDAQVADSMSPGQFAALLALLTRYTTAESAWFLWGPHDDAALRGYPQLELTWRSYYLLHGPLSAYADFPDNPAYWWPEDRAWCLSTDMDFEWSYLGGPAQCVAQAVATPVIDALETRPQNPARAGMDLINRQP
jgi:hypothetical protein